MGRGGFLGRVRPVGCDRRSGEVLSSKMGSNKKLRSPYQDLLHLLGDLLEFLAVALDAQFELAHALIRKETLELVLDAGVLGRVRVRSLGRLFLAGVGLWPLQLLLVLLPDGGPPLFAEAFEGAGGGGEVELLLGPANFGAALDGLAVEGGVLEVLGLAHLLKHLLIGGAVGHVPAFGLLDGHAVAHVGLEVVQPHPALELLHRPARLQLLPVAPQLVSLEGRDRLVLPAEDLLASVDGGSAAPVEFAAPLQKAVRVVDGENVAHAFPLPHLGLHHGQERHHEVPLALEALVQRHQGVVREDILADPDLNFAPVSKDHARSGPEVPVHAREGCEVLEQPLQLLVGVAEPPCVEVSEETAAEAGCLKQQPPRGRVDHVDNGHVRPWDVSAGGEGFCETLRRIEERLAEPELADVDGETGVVQVGEALRVVAEAFSV